MAVLKIEKNTRFTIYGILVLIALINAFPFFNMLLNSLRPQERIVESPFSFDSFSFDNFIKVQEHANVLMGLFNGFWISVCSILLLVFIGSLSAYAFVFINMRVTPLIVGFISIGYFIPPASIMISAFLLIKNLGLLNTYTGITLLFGSLFTPITMFILTGYMKSIPSTILEAAKIDGAGHWRTFLSVVFPLTKPAVVTATILLFLWTYRDFMWPLILMTTPEKRTISVILPLFYSDRFADFGLMSAAVVISLIPILAVYVKLHDQIMRGMAAGSVKG